MPLPEELAPLHGFFMVVSFLFGSVIGSFCNVCICRWPAGESVVYPGSRCPKCGKDISWYDNIPILSWLILRAKCRNCGLPISWQYPLVELTVGLLFTAVYARFGYVPVTPVYMLLCAGLAIVVVQDLETWTIPDQVTLGGIVAGLVVAGTAWYFPHIGARIVHPLAALDGIVLGAFIICLMDGVAVLALRKAGMGFGDVKLLAMLGAFLGWQGVLGVIMMGSMIGSVVGLAMVFYFQRKGGDVEEEEEAPDEKDCLYPVDPLAGVVLGAAALYLFTRVTLYFHTHSLGVFDVAKNMLQVSVGLTCLLAIIVAATMLAIHYRQKPLLAAMDEREAAEDSEEISLQNHYLPFGPYLAAGGVMYLFFGPEMLAAYLASMT